MRRWLGRLWISCFAVAAVLAMAAYRASEGGANLWRPGVDLFAAAAAVSLGAVGVRERHRGNGDM